MKTEKTESSLRDQLAMAALAGGLEQGVEDAMGVAYYHSHTKIAKRAYAIADAMMKESAKAWTPRADDSASLHGPCTVITDGKSRIQVSPLAQPTFTIPEFCQAHGNISKSFFHKLVNDGRGPRVMKLGHRTLITAEAAAEWRAKMEGKLPA